MNFKKAIVDYLIIGVVVKIIQGAIGEEVKRFVLKPLLSKLKKLFSKWFIKTEKDSAAFLHGINKSLKKRR